MSKIGTKKEAVLNFIKSENGKASSYKAHLALGLDLELCMSVFKEYAFFCSDEYFLNAKGASVLKMIDTVRNTCQVLGCSGLHPETCKSSPWECAIIKKILHQDS